MVAPPLSSTFDLAPTPPPPPSAQLNAARRETELTRQQSDIDQELLRDENETLRAQVAKLQAALKKTESRAKKTARLLKEKEEKYDAAGNPTPTLQPSRLIAALTEPPPHSRRPRERLEAVALENMATQVERNLEGATRRALAAETEANALRQEVQRLRQERAVRRPAYWGAENEERRTLFFEPGRVQRLLALLANVFPPRCSVPAGHGEQPQRAGHGEGAAGRVVLEQGRHRCADAHQVRYCSRHGLALSTSFGD